MRTIWKYDVTPSISQMVTIEVPRGAILRHFNTQHERLVVWMEVDAKTDKLELRTFVVVGTGTPIPIPEEAAIYRGTTFANEFVFHLYEEIRGHGDIEP